jgi:hypothetical protein
MYIGQNTSYRLNVGQNENIGIVIGGQFVGIGKNIGWENIPAGPISIKPC